MVTGNRADSLSSAWDDRALEAALRGSLTLLDPESQFRESLRLRLLEAELAPSTHIPWRENLPRGVLMGVVGASIATAALLWWRSRRSLLAGELGDTSAS